MDKRAQWEKRYAAYCDGQPQKESDSWLVKYRCSVKLSDVLSLYASLSLLLVTAGLLGVGICQIKIYSRMREIMATQTNLLKRQADIQEQGLTRNDWPYVLVKEHIFRTPFYSNGEWPPVTEYELIFHGRTPAIVQAVYGELIWNEYLPRIPDNKVSSWVPIYELRYEGSVRGDTAKYRGDLTPELEAEWRGGKRLTPMKYFFLVGRVVYDDVFRNQHEFGFCFRCMRRGGEGQPYGGAAYNYRRLRKPEERI